MPVTPSLAIDPAIDVRELAGDLSRRRRIRIDNFLAAHAALLLREHLIASQEWRHVIKGGERVFETSSEQMDRMPAAERQVLDQAIFREAAQGFRFRYDTIRVPDSAEERRNVAAPLRDFADFMASPAMIAFFRRITGNDDIVFVDAQATRYRRGDFLTRHDDAVGGKYRSHAFVLGLSQTWQADWGGLLIFNDDNSDAVEAMAPAFNTLDLFAVGQSHSVSYVAPYADGERLSITGWLRTALP